MTAHRVESDYRDDIGWYIGDFRYDLSNEDMNPKPRLLPPQDGQRLLPRKRNHAITLLNTEFSLSYYEIINYHAVSFI